MGKKHSAVVLLEDIEDQLAEKFVAICPVKVFDIEDIGKDHELAHSVGNAKKGKDERMQYHYDCPRNVAQVIPNV
ncbi:hypothetical protein ACE6H2_007417 [Prunus campanulata]